MQANPNPTRRRILVVANETIEGPVLHQAVRTRALSEGSEVFVVAPKTLVSGVYEVP